MRRKPLILVSLLLAAFAINLDTTIVNVALPTLVRELHASNSQLQWVVDAFNLVFAATVLAAGSISDRFGRKGMLLAGLAVFGLASAAAGLSDSTGALIAWRCVMGLGAAMVFPSTLSLISNVFTERRERALAIGLWGAITGVAIALGPIVGVWLLQVSGWTAIFFAMTPVAALGIALAALGEHVRDERQRRREHHRRPEAHDRARRDQLAGAVHQPPGQAGQAEHRQPGKEHALASEPVRQAARRQDRTGEHEVVGVHHPLQL